MPDIFISYKSEERPVAAMLAARFTEAGYDVWWDAALLAGDRFEDEIASVLNASRAAVVLWSRKAAASDWVKAEAESARQQKKALPAIIDDLPPENLPLLFRGFHAANLRDWSGDSGHPGFAALMSSVRDRLGEATGPHLSTQQAEAKLERSAGEAEVWAAVAGSPVQSADEYRAYLKRFGTGARFAEIAEIRIIRLEQDAAGPTQTRKKGAGNDRAPPRRNWWPAIVLPLLALIIIAGGYWYWQQNPDLFVPQEVKDAATRCTAWSTSANLNWQTDTPELDGSVANDCEKAAAGFAQNGDYQGMLALVRIAQYPKTGGDARVLVDKGIALGSAVSNYVLGILYQHGIDYKVDISKAVSAYKAAYALKYVRAAAQLCAVAAGAVNSSIVGDLDSTKGYCNAANNAGDPLGQAMLGYFYENNGFGGGYDDAAAARLYRQAADQGLGLAKVLLGAIDVRGEGIQHDPAEAFSLFTATAATGYPVAVRWLAIANELGIGTPVNVPRAGQLYSQADFNFDVVSTFLLGFTVDYDAPANLFYDNEIKRLAAWADTSVGRRMLGYLNEHGMFVANRDSARAVAAYNQCADTNAICQFVLGSFYKYGPPETRDIAKAAALFERSSASGEMHGQFELALLYETGIGETKDIAKAIELYTAASLQGNGAASDAVRRLTQSAGPSAAKSTS